MWEEVLVGGGEEWEAEGVGNGDLGRKGRWGGVERVLVGGGEGRRGGGVAWVCGGVIGGTRGCDVAWL